MPVEYEYLGDVSATPPWFSRYMTCDKCHVSWTGCWDNFQCPRCGEGELPTSTITVINDTNEPMKLEPEHWMGGAEDDNAC